MIAADTSALYAMLAGEEEAPLFAESVRRHGGAIVSAATAFELLMVAHGKGGAALEREAVELLQGPAIRIVPFELAHLWRARDASHRYGKGQDPAALNFGDCISYAVAKAANLPLLFKGEDFARTDIVPAA